MTARPHNGGELRHAYTSEGPLAEGDVISLVDERWLVERVEPTGEADRFLLEARPARFRIVLRHEDGRTEAGAIRRLREEGPAIGHAFTTVVSGQPLGWQVVERSVARDEAGEPFLELVAERDFSEAEAPPVHELEHRHLEELGLPAPGLAGAARPETALELVGVDSGAELDWDAAARFIDALVLEELEDDLVEQCGVNTDKDPRDAWLGMVKRQLQADLERLRAELDSERSRIQQWEANGLRVLASTGTWEDESNPDAPHGWMCRLVDSGALGAAGARQLRRSEL